MSYLRRLKATIFKTKSSDAAPVRCHLESEESDSEFVKLAGWFYYPEAVLALVAGGRTLAVFDTPQRRDDVADFLGIEAAKYCGFKVCIPRELVAMFPKKELRLIGQSTDGATNDITLWENPTSDATRLNPTALKTLANYFVGIKARRISTVRTEVSVKQSARDDDLCFVVCLPEQRERKLNKKEREFLDKLIATKQANNCNLALVYDSSFPEYQAYNAETIIPLADFRAEKLRQGYVIALGDAMAAAMTCGYLTRLPVLAVQEASSTLYLKKPGFESIEETPIEQFSAEALGKLCSKALDHPNQAINEKKSITVILPVYNSLECVKECLTSLAADLAAGDQVVIVDDASEAETREYLEAYVSDKAQFVLHSHKENKGFIAACKTGVSLSNEMHDILLLNSDVVLGRGSLSALSQAAYARPAIAMCSPLSTQSPHFEVTLDNEVSLDEAAGLLQRLPFHQFPTAITPEGQCLYVKRSAINTLGFFDDIYGLGYYEESDLALRYFTNGFDIVSADNTLISHVGGKSFTSERKQKQKAKNRPIFMERYGLYYNLAYKKFIDREMHIHAKRMYAKAKQRRLALGLARVEEKDPNQVQFKILKYPWHTGHDYELAKIPHHFYYLENTYRTWATQQRPVPESINWIRNANEVEADVKILHLDQWSYQEPSKRFFFLQQKKSFLGPKIVVIHGCCTADGMTPEQMQELVEGCYVVCNSPTALTQWNLENSRYILHGFSSDEWPQTNYKLNNIVVTQDYSKRHAGVRNLSGVLQAEEKLPMTWIGRDVRFSTFTDYRAYLAQSSIFFNPSFDSANPRSRAEAMLCGLAVVTTASQDEKVYIENDVNGFCSNDFNELIEYLTYLKAHPEKAEELGRKGRETAIEAFSIARFSNDWTALLNEAVKSERGIIKGAA